MKLTGMEMEMCVHALSTLASDCEKIAREGFNPTRPEIVEPFKESARRYRALAERLETSVSVSA